MGAFSEDFFGAFSELDFVSSWARVSVILAPTEGQMGDHVESTSALRGGPFLRSLFGDEGCLLGGFGGRGGACPNLKILQESAKRSNTLCTTCGVRRILRLRPCRRPHFKS